MITYNNGTGRAGLEPVVLRHSQAKEDRMSARRRSLAIRALRLLLPSLLAWAATLAAGPGETVISVYQGPSLDGDFAGNLAVVRQVIGEAQACGSDFLAFPETFLSGYQDPAAVRRGARPLDDPELAAFIAESAGHEMVILVGLARLTAEGIYNTVLVIEGGKLLGTYDKVMLTGGDRDKLGFLPGQSVPVFEAKGKRFAAIICHDTSFPHLALIARLKGAQLLFTPHYNCIDAQRVDEHRITVRNCHIGLAAQLKLVVARANVVVTDLDGKPGYGDSFVMSPRGEILAGARLFRTEMVTARVPEEMFADAEHWASFDEVPEWVGRELGELLQRPRAQR